MTVNIEKMKENLSDKKKESFDLRQTGDVIEVVNKTTQEVVKRYPATMFKNIGV